MSGFQANPLQSKLETKYQPITFYYYDFDSCVGKNHEEKDVYDMDPSGSYHLAREHPLQCSHLINIIILLEY